MSGRSQVICVEVLIHVIEQLCSLSAREHNTQIASRIVALILELMDSLQSCRAGCITSAGSLKSLFSPHFILFSN